MKKGWEYKKLGDIANDMYRGSGIKREQVTDTGIPCVRYGEIYTTYNIAFDKCASHTNEEIISSPKYFETGDILFAITGESVEEIGKSIAYLGKEKCMCGGDIVVMKHSQYPKYLSYALSSPKAIKQKGLGKTKLKVVHTNIPSLKEISIPVPPLSEQKEIVEYLDSSFAKIDTLKANAAKNLDEAKALFQSALKEALEPKKGWEKKTLGEIAKFSQGLQVDVNNQYESQGDGMVRFLRIIDFTQGNQPPRFITKPDDKYFLKKHEIAIVRYGSSNGFVCYGYEGVIANNLFKVTIVNTNQLSYNYLRHVLKSENFQGRLRKNIGGTAMPAISFGQIKDIPIPFPSSIEVQEKIVSRLDSLNEKANTLQQNYSRICSECDALKQAILRQVFE